MGNSFNNSLQYIERGFIFKPNGGSFTAIKSTITQTIKKNHNSLALLDNDLMNLPYEGLGAEQQPT